jgi:hypothetical protein
MAARKAPTQKTPTRSKKKLVEGHSNELAGFGKETIKLIDTDNNQTVCFLGLVEGDVKVFFPKPACLEQLEAVAELIQKKKLKKFFEKSVLDKATEFAERKLSQILG